MKTPLCFLFALVVSMSSALAAIPEEIEGPDLLTKNSLALAMSGTEKTVVFFVSPNCPCSKAHEPTMKTLFEKFGTQFRFVAVHANQNETADSARDYYAAAKFPFPVLRDEDSQLANGLGALKTRTSSFSKEIAYCFKGESTTPLTPIRLKNIT